MVRDIKQVGTAGTVGELKKLLAKITKSSKNAVTDGTELFGTSDTHVGLTVAEVDETLMLVVSDSYETRPVVKPEQAQLPAQLLK